MRRKHTGRNNKYIYLFVLQGNYGYGWDDLCSYDTNEEGWYKEYRDDVKAYRENEPGVPHRSIYRREPNPNYVEF